MTMTAMTAVPGIDDQESAASAPAASTRRHLVALDVDGTLVDHDGTMTAAVRDAATAVVDAGHEVVIATGRSLGAMLPVVEQIGMVRGYGVCSNGGVTVRLDPALDRGYEVVERVTFSPRAALTTLREKIPGARFALEDGEGNFLSTSRFQDASFGIEARGVDFNHLLDARAVRVVVNSAEASTEDFSAAIAAAGLHGVAYAVGWSAWLDIAAYGVTKATALEKLRAGMGIDPGLTVAVGDGSNDIDMLRWAGRGVAMGQAAADVLAAANEVTDSVYDDGAAAVLRSLLA
ncbi:MULTISPECIES: HAD family hydrolase [unclassified Arthrobacter]|uniref:HAD family hydrolase n=1 Tax=unclassified Arthrobacter TaxID=235627 RepID=UPI00159E07CA|nr:MULTISPECIES: HAD family hydrolase [unclassified Arthrobacter]MCQ9162567.1 Cof-type HAD-IIB family hydrolase [Arthrobacter sp. STN4]NVM98361.1 HAD family phosphatase [Arthrobacter sp. SDTb3-6]